MTISAIHLRPLVPIIAGVVILLAPRIFNYTVAAYLIITGLIELGFIRW